MTLNIKLEVMGKENIPTTPCVIISNHQSTWETIGLQRYNLST
jgi:1-acyl-sn-glycerol-3-phosphate acyltransferase